MTRPALFVVKATIAPELEPGFNEWYDRVRSKEAAKVPGCLLRYPSIHIRAGLCVIA